MMNVEDVFGGSVGEDDVIQVYEDEAIEEISEHIIH